METVETIYLEGHLLQAHVKHMYKAENPEYLEKLRDMAHKRIDTIYTWRLEELIQENARLLDTMNVIGDTIIIRKDYDYMDQCASSYFRVPTERAEDISKFIDEEYSHHDYAGEDMEHLIAKELEIEFLAKVWEVDAGPMCSYEPYEKQQEQLAQAQGIRPHRKR